MNEIEYRRINDGETALGYFKEISDYLRGKENLKLTIPAGDYVCGDDYTRDLQEKITRGNFPYNPYPFTQVYSDLPYVTVLEISGVKNVTVSAAGVYIISDGVTGGLKIENSENVVINGVTFDWLKKPFTRCKITAAESDGYAVIPETPLCEQSPVYRFAIYDKVAGKFDYGFGFKAIKIAENGNVKLIGVNAISNHVGNDVYLCHLYNYRPTICAERVRGLNIFGVTVHANMGMALDADCCENVRITNSAVVPSAGYEFSTNSDALHFISCRGEIAVRGCRFRGAGDDFFNAHTFYHEITAVNGNEAMLILKKHTQSGAAALFGVGDEMQVRNKRTCATGESYVVKSCELLHREMKEQITRVRFDCGLPEDIVGCEIADISAVPHVTFSENLCENGFARGALIKSPGDITDNVFKNLGVCGVKLSAESFYKEGVNPKNVTIKDNCITGCGYWYTTNNTGGIVIDPEAEEKSAASIENVKIIDNKIICPDTEHAVFITGASDVALKGNVTESRGKAVVKIK